MRQNHQHSKIEYTISFSHLSLSFQMFEIPRIPFKFLKLANLTSAPFRGCFLFTPHMPNHLQTLMRCLDQGAPFLLTFHVGYSQSARSGTRCCRLSTCSSTAAQLLNLAAAANHSLLGGIKKVFPLVHMCTIRGWTNPSF